MTTHAVFIREVSSGVAVAAELDDELSLEALLDVEAAWASHREKLRTALLEANIDAETWPESLHWDWSRKSVVLGLTLAPHDYRVFGLRHQGQWEGAMVTLTETQLARLEPDRDQAQIYVDYLESAPWNWTLPQVCQKRKFAGIGRALMRAAVLQSLAENRAGRLSLHALPQAEGIYRSFGFAFVDFDPAKENLAYYELTKKRAAAFLSGA